MKKLQLIVRILLGLMLIILGFNKFLQFMPMPPMSQEASAFIGALVKSGYLMVIVAVVEIITGVLLLVDKYQPLTLIVLFPAQKSNIFKHKFVFKKSPLGGFLFHLINFKNQLVSY